MWRRLVVVLAAIMLLASGCFWSQPGFDATGSNNNFTETGIGVNNVASLHTRWSASLGKGTTAIIQSDVGLIDVSDGTTLTALDPKTGATAWSRTEPSGVTVSGATGDGDDILVTTFDAATQTANLEVRDARTGATVSATPIAPTGETPTIPVTTVSGVTKTGPWAVTWWGAFNVFDSPPSGEGGFQVTNLDDPSLSWRFDDELAPPDNVDFYDKPIIVGDRLYLEHIHQQLGSSNLTSTVRAWNLSGCTNQCAPLFETSDAAFTAGAATPVGSRDGRAVYAGTGAGFAAFDPATGAMQWEAAIAGNSDTQVIATTHDAEVVSSRVTNGGDQLAVYPKTCAAARCAATWTTSIPSGGILEAAVANRVIYVSYYDPTSMQTLAAYPLECSNGCQPIWTMPVGDEVTSGPIVSNGKVLYGTFSGKVVALTP